MSFLTGLGGPLAGALGGAITPLSGLGQIGGPLSGIGLLGQLFGGKGSEDSPAQPQANDAAVGLGKLLSVDPDRISSIASSVGKAANPIAAAGGASEGYTAPQLPSYGARPNNILQALDPKILQALIQQFGGGNR